MDDQAIKALLRESFNQFVTAAHPSRCIRPHLPEPPSGRTIVLGAGKAAAAMALELEANYKAPLEGLVITRYGHALPTEHIKVVEAGHPVPDKAGEQAVKEIEQLAKSARPEDLVICLLSGGGSALLSAPVEGLSFEAVQEVTGTLLKSGASIDEINCIRKHLNRLLGGGLANALQRSSVLTLAISDVVGDDPSTIASGPTVADPTSLEDAVAIIERYEIKLSEELKFALTNPLNETPKPEAPLFERQQYRLIATPSEALDKVCEFWKSRDIEPVIFAAEITGETNQAARAHVDCINRVLSERGPLTRPLAILSGGETTVKIEGKGKGGPNTQFALASAISLNKAKGIYALACDSDGFDGSGDNAGALITPETLTIANDLGLDARSYLANNDSYSYFRPLEQLVITGATHTNINDYRVFILLPGVMAP